MRPPSNLLTLSEHECRHLLGVGDVGRVVVSVDAMPAALPVNYRIVDNAIVFRTAPGTKLTAAVDQAVVGFEVDEIDRATNSGWSVLVVGRSAVVDDEKEIAELERAEIPSWTSRELPYFVKVEIAYISGRRLAAFAP